MKKDRRTDMWLAGAWLDERNVLRAKGVRKVIVNQLPRDDGSSLWRFRVISVAQAVANSEKLRRSYARIADGAEDIDYANWPQGGDDPHAEAHALAVRHHQHRRHSLLTDTDAL
jgi:hypothetical protein